MYKSTLFIFDWDDTLFPTNWLYTNINFFHNSLYKREYIKYFLQLDKLVASLLIIGMKYGKVIIITNANIEWVLLSKKYLPNTSVLLDSKIDIISARDLYQSTREINDWKIFVFNNNIINLINQAEQIISIGDAYYEYNALISLKNKLHPSINLKAIKLMKTPTFEKLIEQIELLLKSIDKIINYDTHLDLKFSDIEN